MAEIKMYECDECGYTSKQDDPNMSVDEELKLCSGCNKDICGQCAEQHAKDELG